MKTHEHAIELATALHRVTRELSDFENMTEQAAAAMRNARAALAAWNEHNRPKTFAKVRQTACRYCGLDIEGFYPYRRGEWRDRGNNTTCPHGSKTGKPHAPTP